MRLGFRVVMVLVLVIGAGTNAPGGGHNARQVAIGVVGPLTGPSAAYGTNQLRGARMAADDWNASGLVGQRLVVVARDDGGEMGRVGALARDLIFETKVRAFVGAVNSSCTHVLEMICVKAHIPQITAVSTDPTITQAGSPWIFRCLADDVRQARALAAHIFERRRHRRVALLVQGSRYGRRGGREMARLARERGTPLLLHEVFSSGAASHEALTRRLAASRPDAVVFWSLFEDGARLVRQVRRAGVRAPFFGPDGLALHEFITEAGAAAEGMVVTWPFDAERRSPTTRDFCRRYEERHGKPPDSFAAHAYDAVGLLAEAIRQGGTDPYEIRDALSRTAGYRGVTGSISFDATGNDTRSVELARVERGRFVELSASVPGSSDP